MKPVDAHCHLDFERFDSDREEVIERSRQELDFVSVAGCSPERNEAVKELCEPEDFLVPCYGLHPTFTDSFDSGDEVERQVRNWEPAAVGEIGLDHHHVDDDETRDRQREVFRSMLQLAEELGLPVVVHSREAEEECIETVEDYDVTALFHCFNGSPELARKAVDSGHLIGVTTQVLYSSRVKSIVEELGIEGIVLETDAPFLYPEGRNEPANVVESVSKVAEILGADEEEVVEATTSRARNFFGIR